MDKGTFNLAWSDEERTATMFDAFKSILETEEYLDVSLVSQDCKVVKAHRLMLSASSPFFRTLFASTGDNKELVVGQSIRLYLHGVMFRELQSIIEFIYKGETNVPAATLDTFIRAAKQLKVKGLTNIDLGDAAEVDTEAAEETEVPIERKGAKVAGRSASKKVPTTYSCGQCDFTSTSKDKMEMHEFSDHSDSNQGAKADKFKEEIPMVNTEVGFIKEEPDQSLNASDNFDNSTLSEHDSFIAPEPIQKMEEEAPLEFPCAKCQYVGKTKVALTKHMKTHSGAAPRKSLYSCDVCDYRARSQENLDRHKKYIVHK